MLTHRHLGFRPLVVAALLSGLIAAAPATARHEDRARYDIARLAHGLEVATDQVRRQIRQDFYRDRGRGEGRLERDLTELQWQAARFRQEVERRSPSSRHARSELAALLQRFYDADRTIRQTAVPGHARNEFERARFFMDTLIERYGGYRHFQHVRPSGHDRVVPYGHDRRDDRRRAYPRRW